MKAFFISVLFIFLLNSGASAQIFPPELNWEVGLNGGYSVCTRPLGPPQLYCGTRTNIVSDYSLRAGYFFTPHWQMNLDIGDRHWESYGTWKLNGLFGKNLQPQNITFLIADHSISENIQMNFVIPFYTNFQVYNKANLYFGTDFGLITTVNDGSTTFSKYKSPTDSGYKYLSKFDYNMGIGFNFGAHIGFTYYFVPKLGVNIELGARYASVGTNSTENNHEIGRFYLLYFPETIGIRYKF